MRSECKRSGLDLDLHELAGRASDWARRDGTVRSAAGVFVEWTRREIRERTARNRESREQLARDRARMAELWVRLFAILVRRRPGPRQLADELEVLQRSGYPAVAPVVERLRRLGDCWPEAP
jgi:hypothetical protein